MRLPPDARSAGRGRRMLQDALDRGARRRRRTEPPVDDLLDTAVLLASELCENAVLHAGTEFELAVTVTDAEVTVAVTDRGNGPLEMHLAQPRPRYGRAASHGRGLAMVQRLASAWGTRHESDGRHVIWFSLARGRRPGAGRRAGRAARPGAGVEHRGAGPLAAAHAAHAGRPAAAGASWSPSWSAGCVSCWRPPR